MAVSVKTPNIQQIAQDIQQQYVEAMQRSDGSSMRIDSMQLDDLGDGVLFNLGTFAGSVRTEEGEQQVEAEYVALVKRERGTFKIYRLVSFMRGLPGQKNE